MLDLRVGSSVLTALRICFTLLLLSYGACQKKSSQGNVLLPPKAEEALRSAPELILFSLDPELGAKTESVPRLQGFRILGQMTVDIEVRQRVVRALHESIERWDGKMSLCFYPRHAVRATLDGTSYDFLMCYECGNLEVFGSNENPTVVGISGSGEAFNAIFRDAGIPLAAPPIK